MEKSELVTAGLDRDLIHRDDPVGLFFLQVEKTKAHGEGFAKRSYELLSAFHMPDGAFYPHKKPSMWGLYCAHVTMRGLTEVKWCHFGVTESFQATRIMSSDLVTPNSTIEV